MIVYYTEYRVIESFDIKDFLDYSFNCMKGMRNLPASFLDIGWDGNESKDWKCGKNSVSYEIDTDSSIAAFRVSITDENNELWTEDLVLRGDDHRLQLRLAREKAFLSADFDKNFKVPYIFKKLVRDGISGQDNDLAVVDTPIFVGEENCRMIADIINGNRNYILPVVYVSHFFSGEDEYALDVVELAKDLAGSAHVLVEKTSIISRILKELTNNNNPYNGAVDIYFVDASFRYIKQAENTYNQFRHKITRAIFVRMSMRNIDEDSSLSAIRINNKIKRIKASDKETQLLRYKNERLEEEKRNNEELLKYAIDENSRLEKLNNQLENKNIALKMALESKGNTNDGDSIMLYIKEKQFYEDETKRFVLNLIKRSIDTYGDNEKEWREYHILSDIIDNNHVSEEGESIKNKLYSVLKNDNQKRIEVYELSQIGFEIEKNSHDKYIFHDDDRYTLTIANTPSDFRNRENLAHEAVKLIFGRS